MGACAHDPDLAREVAASDYIFHGTVLEVGATTQPDEGGPLDHLAIVRIDRDVVRGANITELPHGWGDRVTVQLTGPAVKVGEHLMLLTRLANYNGGQLELGELGRDPRAIDADIMKLHDQLAADPLQREIATSDLIVAGKVAAIRTLPVTGPISEHNPGWRLATIQVDASACGAAGKTVQIAFAGSDDVAWVGKAKLSIGQEGVFLAHRSGMASPALIVVDPLDVQPRSALAGIESRI
jgi:hypothetical protein